MRQEDCSTLWDLQQKMLDGRMWSVCNVGLPVCSVEQTEDAAVMWYNWSCRLHILRLNKVCGSLTWVGSQLVASLVYHMKHLLTIIYQLCSSSSYICTRLYHVPLINNALRWWQQWYFLFILHVLNSDRKYYKYKHWNVTTTTTTTV